jgi:beta-xylosidase
MGISVCKHTFSFALLICLQLLAQGLPEVQGMAIPPSMMQPLNPIIPGYAPDPSIVKVDDWFYLATSSFHLFPGLPIYASQDLVSWQHIGTSKHWAASLTMMQPIR